MGVSETRRGIDAIVLPQRSQAAVRTALNGKTIRRPASGRLRAVQQQVTDYLTGRRRSFDLPVDLSSGTPFQRQVWRTLLRVPYGKLRSYQWVASRVGGRVYARAVGNAVGANPVPILVPCHRIIAQDASLGGFSGGLTTKRKLLKLEGTLSYVKPSRRSRPRDGRDARMRRTRRR